jgi:hypothetical protein
VLRNVHNIIGRILVYGSKLYERAERMNRNVIPTRVLNYDPRGKRDVEKVIKR